MTLRCSSNLSGDYTFLSFKSMALNMSAVKSDTILPVVGDTSLLSEVFLPEIEDNDDFL